MPMLRAIRDQSALFMVSELTSLRIPLLLLLLAFFAGGATAWAQPTGPTQPVYLEHADKFLGYKIGEEEVNELVGNVRITQGVVHIESDRAMIYPARNYVVLTGNVRVTQPGQVLLAPRAEYDGTTRIATAPTGVTLHDGGATLRAGAGTYNMYDRIARFREGVTLEDDNSTLRANSGEYYSVERRAIFNGGVKVDNDSGTITARDLIYWRDSRETHAFHDVVVISRQHAARLTGDTVIHRPAIGYTYAIGSPKLVQIDTVRADDSAGSVRRDTTVIIAKKMEAFRADREEYLATDSVKLLRGDLQAVAALARFLPDRNMITLGPGSRPGDTGTIDTARPPRDTTVRDTADSNAVAGVRPGARAVGPYPVVWYEKSQLTGDSIVVGLLEKKLRSIDVTGNAFAVTEGKVPQRYDQLAGIRLFFDVLRDTIRQVRSEGLASSIYYLYENDDPNGVNRASGDTIIVDFAAGDATNIALFGGRARVEGEYFPENLVAGQETLYRLEGFRWIGRDGSVAALNGSLPRAPAIQDVKPEDPNARGAQSTTRPR
jgi:lipopolysaccharide export system protein LptA